MPGAGAPNPPRAFCSSEGSPGHLQQPCAERQGHKTQACVSRRGGLALPGHVRSWFALLGPRGAGGNRLSSCWHTPSGNAEDAGTLGQWQGEKKNPTGSWRAGCNEAAAVPGALIVSRGPQPLAASPVWGRGSPTVTHGAPSGDPKDACPAIWGGRGCSPACCDALWSSGRARQPG